MKAHHSIRWRLQLWHGLLLALVMAGFVLTGWQLQRANQLRRIDQELEQRLAVVAGSLRRGPGGPDRGVPDFPPESRRGPGERPGFDGFPPPRPEVRLPEREQAFFDPGLAAATYYVVWSPMGREVSRSESAPANVPRPERTSTLREARMRGTLRECFHHTPPGHCILVGRDIADELSGTRRFVWILSAAGCVVLALGWAVGWWISARALRPIADISATAARISNGDLSQRIPTTGSSSELDGLVHILNGTFDRLQSSFARQAQFTADASHELRTPLSVLLTQTQTALARERLPAEYRESLAACQRAAQRMRRLTESLLTLARIDSGQPSRSRETCDLARIATESVELLSVQAQERQVTVSLDCRLASCEGDAGELAQVVTNLVANALLYNRPGGTVRVRTGHEAADAFVIVSDTGLGIAPEDLPRVYDRFYRVDKARSSVAGGAGLGLAITKALVEAHEGTIEVTSELGKGSTFVVRIPSSGPARGAR